MNKISLLLALGLLVGGCARKATPVVSTTGPKTSVPVAEPTVRATNTSFLFLNAKGKAQINMKGDKQSANISLRMRRDSVIWVTAGLLGVEGVRAVLTPDSVRVVNKLEKTYFTGGYDYLSKLLNVPVSFAQMQAILLGDYLPAPAGTTPTIATEEADRQRVSYPLAGVLVERLLQPGTGRVQQMKVSDAATQRNLTVDYTDFKPLEEPGNLPFANSVFIQAQQPSAGAVTAAINYSKVNVGRERLSFPFSVPKGYKRQK
ncbi:DUF4292 domain-containing protein [Hymenobacter properus]|uniref:DUF4292 domain-containing protein n=1 Tax=Hymenobacter properus TaxID=2791026 RepID=A0A931BFV9_9BACT|nr:DUF4292 domain-containing protein [Hymenobacter properus]MBF9143154.1 DUF4292 domain-containing protein [Hymenobacter properus]MBR7721962.1 DUF4292 domain-containing protein [Microvirga sp. SRT04]